MRRGTTPDYILAVTGEDLRNSAIFVTVRQGSEVITLAGNRLTVAYDGEMDGCTSIMFRLTQRETLALKAGQASVQARWVDADGTALATEIKTIGIMPVLLEEVIAYDGTSSA